MPRSGYATSYRLGISPLELLTNGVLQMSNPPTLQVTPNVISLLVSESGAMRYVNQDGLTVDLFGRVVAHANPSAQQATGGGVTDKRHLWPTWFNLIRKCRPPVIFGEQVESAINHGWLDLVQTDLEGEDYACGAVGLPAGGVGAPHIRQRLWFVADADCGRYDGRATATGQQAGASTRLASGGASDKLANSQRERLERHIGNEFDGNEPRQYNAQQARPIAPSSVFDKLADTNGTRSAAWISEPNDGKKRNSGIFDNGSGQKFSAGFRPKNFWVNCDWLPCRDGKARPVEPGTFPLAHGATARVGRLRAYGNAIVPQVAQTLIKAYLES